MGHLTHGCAAGTESGKRRETRYWKKRSPSQMLTEARCFWASLNPGADRPVAAAISPIPRCADLAERLKLVFRDCVEPQMPIIEIFAVPTDGESGVVIIRTGRSRMAPHRVTTTFVCPIRRSDRCEKMTMREIQDLTLNLSRGLERLERRLETRSKRFVEEFKRITSPDRAHGIRVTATPVGDDVRFERVYDVTDLCEPWHRVFLAHQERQRGVSIPQSWQRLAPNAACCEERLSPKL